MSSASETVLEVSQAMAARSEAWRSESVGERIRLLKDMRLRILPLCGHWARASAECQGLSGPQSAAWELQLFAVGLTASIDGLLRTLEEMVEESQGGEAAVAERGLPCPTPAREVRGVRCVRSFPRTLRERWLSPASWAGLSVDVYLEPYSSSVVPQRAGSYCKAAAADQGGVGKGCERSRGPVIVFEPGAASPVWAVAAALHVLFVRRSPALLVLPERQRALQAPLEYFLDAVAEAAAFASVAAADPWAQVVEAVAAQEEAVAGVHLLGAHASLRRALESDVAARRGGAAPACVTADEPGVAPWLVCPGAWSAAELAHQAGQLAGALLAASSAHAFAPRVLVLAEDWDQRGSFLALLERELTVARGPPAFDPGAGPRQRAWAQACPSARVLVREAAAGRRRRAEGVGRTATTTSDADPGSLMLDFEEPAPVPAVVAALEDLLHGRKSYAAAPFSEDEAAAWTQEASASLPSAEAIAGAPPPLPVYLLELSAGDAAASPALYLDPRAPVLTVVTLPPPPGSRDSASGFLDRAVSFVNASVAGSFGATLCVSAAEARTHAAAVEEACQRLQYGLVVLNGWLGCALAAPQALWGTFRGPREGERKAPERSAEEEERRFWMNSDMWECASKAVVRTPSVSAFHPQPRAHVTKTPREAKAQCALFHSGIPGMLKVAMERGEV